MENSCRSRQFWEYTPVADGKKLNARVKPDIGTYANEDLPKDGDCVSQAKLMLGLEYQEVEVEGVFG
jgi:hypothetical protein